MTPVMYKPCGCYQGKQGKNGSEVQSFGRIVALKSRALHVHVSEKVVKLWYFSAI